jgi:hydroxyacylglutathione hydrolase
MFLKQISDPALAQYSYLIGCQRTGEAVIVDPERDIDRYQEIAKHEGLKITAVAETHIHADFVSGAREFAATDPTIKLYLSEDGGPDWQSEWAKDLPAYHPLHDGDSFKIGNIELQAVHTPGHTPEHMVFLVTDHGGGANEPIAMLSGDFLFVGDAGRPDLLEQAAGLEGTQEQGARALYKSLRKVSELPCHLQVLPAHGAGSACGKALGSIPNSTFGYEEKFNPALKLALNESEEAFVNFILSGQPEPPAYFANMKHVNKVGPAVLGELPKARLMSLAEILPRLSEPGFVVLDTRSRSKFLNGHLRGSLFTPPEKFSDFAGSFLAPEQEIAIVADDADAAQDCVRQLVRIGFDRIAGFFPTPALAEAPAELMTKFQTVDFHAVPALLGGNGDDFTLDVRKATEFGGRHIQNAHNIAHTRLRHRLAEVPRVPLVVHCQTGQRATGASAFLARNGYEVTCVADKFENAPGAVLA